MRLTGRFFAMNALAVLVSLGIAALAAMVFAAVYAKLAGTDVGARDLQRALDARAGLAAIRAEAERLDFGELLDPQYQARLAERAGMIGADAYILLDRKTVFATSPLDDFAVEQMLILTSGLRDGGTLELGGRAHMAARADFDLPGGSRGTLILLAQIRPGAGFAPALGITVAAAFLLSFLTANFLVSRRFFRSVIAPVARLKEAAVNIGNGELDFGIAEEGEGEVRELCRMLELMRIKLKESVHWQEKSDENRRFLISSISHDLKTPVTSIVGYLDGILDGVANTPEKRKQYLETAKAKALAVNAMIDDLLLYARLDMDQVPFHFEPADARAFLEDCVDEFRPAFLARGAALSFAAEFEGPVWVRMDRARFRRVIQNILDNCLKYMDRQDGRVDVLLRRTGTSAVMEVRDNGRGVPMEELHRLFDRFYRGDPSRGRTEGTGLGLAIAKQIVEGHGGRIWARGGTAGGGSGERGLSILMSLPILAGPRASGVHADGRRNEE